MMPNNYCIKASMLCDVIETIYGIGYVARRNSKTGDQLDYLSNFNEDLPMILEALEDKYDIKVE